MLIIRHKLQKENKTQLNSNFALASSLLKRRSLTVSLASSINKLKELSNDNLELSEAITNYNKLLEGNTNNLSEANTNNLSEAITNDLSEAITNNLPKATTTNKPLQSQT
ncbi:13461_t:CDS:2 [Cetraspora pellucida]|uniref:13461_t:CDS:1 n=1 Tax=Cetraspora pellucida TaxID=1433469 RepID=A0ACA9KV00_9GLOM|nr:13461_t:CDS:2 [Cetraspora pellucida]